MNLCAFKTFFLLVVQRLTYLISIWAYSSKAICCIYFTLHKLSFLMLGQERRFPKRLMCKDKCFMQVLIMYYIRLGLKYYNLNNWSFFFFFQKLGINVLNVHFRI